MEKALLDERGETSPPISVTDPINAQILRVSEDQLSGFYRDPFVEIAARCCLDPELVRRRIAAMLRAGTIRRVRQTLYSNLLAPGALVAWNVPQERLDAAFDFLFQKDPFSGHVVIRSTDRDTPGSRFRLWTTLKVPQGFSLSKHCQWLQQKIGAVSFRLMPARAIFVLGVGHVRRQELEIGEMAPEPAQLQPIRQVWLNEEEWKVLAELKREFSPEEIRPDPWAQRATQAGMSLSRFFEIAEGLSQKGVLGRFSTFLEHVKPLKDGYRVTLFNALFHWALPPGWEEKAGCEIGRFRILTHAYWREAGKEFENVNLMAVAHGKDKRKLLAHKEAIDRHLHNLGIPVEYTNIFWGGRSEIKPSEILPSAYKNWCTSMGIDWRTMKEEV
ncbi:Lrp/AsnC family transcriptional regulator [Candidatus Methylacidithermus pantelleriae]|uniref:Siroheme decarboxylase n=1 Tax=Candidatus Methylacidithermus pantelleriae TaxID=2744239 RepID=A0A8J2BLZ9_9BACT|nr:Lrp/AsnC family transcriptional regulator [Candidatus Methylacidithermus pantelleriae]CAF0704540.1 Siroheme decarboxylase [Candidatus Methylacidithermus pantelleriae]